jgi:hypothetical protein
MSESLSTPEMDATRSAAAKRGGGWNIPTSEDMFGWLRKWNWMATLFAVVSVGIAAQTIIDVTIVPEPGKISVSWMVPVFLGTVGLNAVKEFYERQAERKAEMVMSQQAERIGALEAENNILKESR